MSGRLAAAGYYYDVYVHVTSMVGVWSGGGNGGGVTVASSGTLSTSRVLKKPKRPNSDTRHRDKPLKTKWFVWALDRQIEHSATFSTPC